MNIPTNIATLIVGVLVTLISFWVGQHHGLLPVAASVNAPLIDGLFDTMITLSVGLFLLVQGALIFALFKFRKPKDDETDGPPWKENLPLEILWTGIPAIIVLGLSVYSFEVYNSIGGLEELAMQAHHHSMKGAAIAAPLNSTIQSSPTEPRLATIGFTAPANVKGTGVTVDVTGLQYAWIFNYPDSGITSGELHLPVGQDVQLKIKAMDVLHAFWVPQFRLKQDAIPGRETELWFKPTVIGTYPIVCAELCGSFHGAMRSQVIIEPQSDYDAWVQQQLADSAPSDHPTIASAGQSQSAETRLAPRLAEMGISELTLAQVHPHHDG